MINKNLLIVVFILGLEFANAQPFQKFGQGLNIQTFYHQQGLNYYLSTADEKGQVYNIYYDTVTSGFNFGNEYSVIRLQIYNGISWLYTKPIRLFSLHSLDAPRVLDIQYIDGEVYVCGSFDSSDNNLGAGMLVFDGENWKNTGIQLLQSSPSYFEVRQVLNFQDQKIITGNFDSIPGVRVNGILWFNGSNWTAVGDSEPYGFRNLSNTDNVFFDVMNDSLYAFNKNKIKPDSIEIGGSISKKLAVFHNGRFEERNTTTGYIAGLASYGQSPILVLSSNIVFISSITMRQGQNWSTYQLGDSFYATNYLGHFEKQGLLFLVFQNPSLARLEVYHFNGNQITKYKTFKLANQYINLEFIHEHGMNVITGPFGFAQIGQYSEKHQSILSLLFNPATLVSGTSFYDNNNDQVKQVNEDVFPQCMVYDDQNKYMIKSDQDGRFLMVLPIGTSFNMAASGENAFLSNQTLTVNNSMDSIYLFDPGMVAQDKNDMSVHVLGHTANKAKQGFVSSYHLDVHNYTSKTQTTTISVRYDTRVSNLTFQNFAPSQSVKGSFNIAVQLPANSAFRYHFSCIYGVDSFTLGEKVKIVAAFDAFDAVQSNNSDTIIQTVVAAFDPNIKVANPDVIVNNEKEISYVIWFQNEGNDTALNVTVVDTFGSLFDLSKVYVSGNSHGNIDPVVSNNCLIWNFRNIYLPPKKHDSVNSIGFVSFRSKLTKKAKVGDTIFNSAAIFFDYQKPVITNKAKVVFSRLVSIVETDFKSGFNIYPNPGKGLFNYENPELLTGNIEVYNINGLKIGTYQLNESGGFQLPEGSAQGVYFVRISGNPDTVIRLVVLNQ